MCKYIIQSLPEYNGIKPSMHPNPYKLSKERMVFHADLIKLIYYWRFGVGCIPSFIDSDEPYAGINPTEIMSSHKDTISKCICSIFSKDEKKYEICEEKMDFKNKYFFGSKFKNSNEYSKRHNWLYHDPVTSTDRTPMMMPVVGYNKSEDPLGFKITTLINQNELRLIDTSRYNIEFEDGRHRTRFLEFLGAKDIYIIIEKNQFQWFHENCAYVSD